MKFQVVFFKIWTCLVIILSVGRTFLKFAIRCYELLPRSEIARQWWLGIDCFETNFDILLQFCVFLWHTKVDFCPCYKTQSEKNFLEGNQTFCQLQNPIKPSIFIPFFQLKLKEREKYVSRTTQIILHEVKSKSPSDRETSFQIRFFQLISREFSGKFLIVLHLSSKMYRKIPFKGCFFSLKTVPEA